MKALVAILALLTTPFFGLGQWEQDPVQRPVNLIKQHYFFVNATPIVDVINPAITLGYEGNISSRHSYQVEIGPILQRSLFGYLIVATTDPAESNPNLWTNDGIKLRAQIKSYTNKPGGKDFYQSLEFFLTQNTSQVSQLYRVSDPFFDYRGTGVTFESNSLYRDFYTLQRNRYGLLYRIGILETDKNGITLDTSVGFGLAFQTGTESNRANPDDEPEGLQVFLRPGNQLLPALSASIKIGFIN